MKTIKELEKENIMLKQRNEVLERQSKVYQSDMIKLVNNPLYKPRLGDIANIMKALDYFIQGKCYVRDEMYKQIDNLQEEINSISKEISIYEKLYKSFTTPKQSHIPEQSTHDIEFDENSLFDDEPVEDKK